MPVATLLIALGEANVFSQIALFFSKMAMVTFGGAYAVLAYVAQQAVEHYHWVSAREMLDGLGMAETTPGPLIMVLQFVGFMAAFRDPGTLSPMLAGTLGGLLATWVTFTPCFLWIFLGAPFIETLRGNKGLAGALSAITAAVVGVILNLSIWFALHTVFRETTPVRSFGLSFDMPVLSSIDIAALVLAIAAATAIFRFNMGMLTVLGGSCAGSWTCRFIVLQYMRLAGEGVDVACDCWLAPLRHRINVANFPGSARATGSSPFSLEIFEPGRFTIASGT